METPRIPVGMKAALFDLDGVIFNTEPIYDIFWEKMRQLYRPDCPEMVRQMKGQTLTFILDSWFSGIYASYRADVVARLNAFEAEMPFHYVPGFEAWLGRLQERGIVTAVVTSSNAAKMAQVERAHPGFADTFRLVLSSGDFPRSKPAPDCYLEAARRLDLSPQDCVVFEDSLNGLRSGRAAGMFTVGLCTTLSPAALAPLADLTIPDFTALL